MKPRNRQERLQLEMYGAFAPYSSLNSIRFASNETLLHLVGKAILAHKLRQSGNFISEAYFPGGEFDLLSLTKPRTAYEIVVSSTPPRFELPNQINDCITVNLPKEDVTIKELSRKIYNEIAL